MIKSILCPIVGGASDRLALDCAAALAQRFLAHVDVLHVKPDATEIAPYLGEGMSPMVISQVIEDAERRAEIQAGVARATFDAWAGEHAIAVMAKPPINEAASCAWLPASGAQEKFIATYGRLADLTVVGVARGDVRVDATLAFETALLETGRPVLLAPSRPLTPTGVAIVAWNGSAEAARAVGAALPLLAAAREVHVVTIEEGHRRADPDAIAQYLSWHRIEARTRLVTDEDAATAIDNACTTLDATLLVMGGYTHSRLRELIFGGVTAHVAKDAKIPVLLAH